MSTIDLTCIEEAGSDDCKGMIFRCKVNNYLSGDGYVSGYKMVLLKRKSCKGCSKCQGLLDSLHEDVNCGNEPIVNEIVHNGLYYLAITNVDTDWETGYVDSCDHEFKLMKGNS